MTSCPYCGVDNIEGVDECAECGQPLTDMQLESAGNPVEESLMTDTIAALSPKQPITITSETPVGEVIRLMVERRIGCLIVVEDERPVGIFSERDALLKLNEQARELADRPVSEFMTSNPQTLEERNKVAFAVQRMDLGGFRHIPILSGSGKLDGIISVRDILKYLTDKMAVA